MICEGPCGKRKGRSSDAPAPQARDRQIQALASKTVDLSLSRAKEAAYRLLSYRDRSSKEIVSKLEEKGFPKEIVSQTISFLKDAGYLDDTRFARQWARSRMEFRRLGPVRLKQELLEKGISSGEADAVLDRLSEERDPIQSAEEALFRRFKDPALLQDLNHRQRAFVFLQRKGFATETILKVFRKIKER